jgi:solute carrier family 13 (sodium-dependent dicarboxylate transporter), member 2/3/5
LNSKSLKILAGPTIAILVFVFLKNYEHNDVVCFAAASVSWMCIWWITEAVNIYITSLLPLALFPLLGIMPMKDVSMMYTNEIIFLYVGGFLLAFGIERWNLHQRFAYKILITIGSEPKNILLGFMLSSFLLSMWISNIATTLMLIPAVLAVGKTFEKNNPQSNIYVPLLLGLAYASSIGGTATLVGTAPNMIFFGYYEQFFPDDIKITFSKWLIFGLPLALSLFYFCYKLLDFIYLKNANYLKIDTSDLSEKYNELGKMSKEEKQVLMLFVTTVLLWFFRSDLEIGSFKIKGWVNLFSFPNYIKDSTVAITMALLLFIIPSKKGNYLLTWNEAKNIPWGIIFLFGGGFAMASGIETSGLSQIISKKLLLLSGLSGFTLILILTIFMVFFTEISSNTTSTYLILPIISGISSNVIDTPALYLMLPVVFAASLAFMLPVATPPNAVIFASEKIKISEMARTGFILNIISIIIVVLFTYFLAPMVFNN